MPLISVIIPIYNVENYLAGCLDSILGQTFQEFELLLVDDGSTDKSIAIAKEYARNNPDKIFIHSVSHGGPGPGAYPEMVWADGWPDSRPEGSLGGQQDPDGGRSVFL